MLTVETVLQYAATILQHACETAVELGGATVEEEARVALSQAYSGMLRHDAAVRELQLCVNKAQARHEMAPKTAVGLLRQEQALLLLQQQLSAKMWPRAPMDLLPRPLALRCPKVAGGHRIGDRVVCIRVSPPALKEGVKQGDVGIIVDVMLEAETLDETPAEGSTPQEPADRELDAFRRKISRRHVPADGGRAQTLRQKQLAAAGARRKVKIGFEAGIVVMDALSDVRKYVFQDAVLNVCSDSELANKQIQLAQRSAIGPYTLIGAPPPPRDPRPPPPPPHQRREES